MREVILSIFVVLVSTFAKKQAWVKFRLLARFQLRIKPDNGCKDTNLYYAHPNLGVT